ncbi:MAG: hypothetical protein LBV06_10075 [Propionibacteriaceae bacterium]|jgi:hypothetical protein|nr:hypothetical protein [Propionibacteriaceae bacterium]
MRAVATPTEPDPLRRLGNQMLRGGLILAAAITVVAVVAVWFVASGRAAVSLAVAGGIALIVMGSGQLVLTAVRRVSSVLTLVIAVGAYVVAISAVIVALVWIQRSDALDVMWLAVGMGLGAYGYLLGAILSHRRARIPVFDQPLDSQQAHHRSVGGDPGASPRQQA